MGQESDYAAGREADSWRHYGNAHLPHGEQCQRLAPGRNRSSYSGISRSAACVRQPTATCLVVDIGPSLVVAQLHDRLLRRSFQAGGHLRASRSVIVGGARGRPPVTAVFRPFWHGRGTAPGCKLLAMLRRR
jgi:hypothetical protein